MLYFIKFTEEQGKHSLNNSKNSNYNQCTLF